MRKLPSTQRSENSGASLSALLIAVATTMIPLAAGQVTIGGWASDPANMYPLNSAAFVALNAWSRIAVSWSTSGARIYVDGMLSASSSQAWQPDGPEWGYLNYWGGAALGLVDELHISNIQRTDAEIAAHSGVIVADGNTVILDHFDGSSVGTVFGSPGFQSSVPGLGDAINLGVGSYVQYALTNSLESQGTIEMWLRPAAKSASILNFNWNNTGSQPTAGHVLHLGLNDAAVPEPSTAGMITLAMLGAGFAFRHRRAKSLG